VLRLGEKIRGGSTAIEQGDIVLSIERSLRNMAADEARASNDEHSHVASALVGGQASSTRDSPAVNRPRILAVPRPSVRVPVARPPAAPVRVVPAPRVDAPQERQRADAKQEGNHEN
jgi:hypothetical protein